MINIKRVKKLRNGKLVNGPVLYWMSRDQRVSDNWALTHAVELAENNDQLVMVVFNLVSQYPGATWRQYDFLLKGLKKIEIMLQSMNIPFTMLMGDPTVNIPGFIQTNNISHLVMDFDPLKIKDEWQKSVCEKIDIPADVVDAHNIVPCFYVSDKEEYAAYTLRPKITKLLPEFLDEFPPLLKQKGTIKMQRTQWEAIIISLKTNHSVKAVEWHVPGEKGATAVFHKFLEEKIHRYASGRNDPNGECTSGLSPYLHFGHISAQRLALEILRNIPRNENTDAFLEELIVRKELADNFCCYNRLYDSTAAFKPWAKNSLTKHLADKREYTYTADQFELAETHDELWNAAQNQLVQTGAMHGYMRMYWAKKILEWTATTEEALKVANYLNDRFGLDGRDPSGYTGCAWAIGGIHDRPWPEREIFGSIRLMNRKGCERKFDVNRYITSVNQIRKSIER